MLFHSEAPEMSRQMATTESGSAPRFLPVEWQFFWEMLRLCK